MKAKELYQALEKSLAPAFVQRGFRKRRGSQLGFQRIIGGTYHTVWFQCDKYGWDAQAGGEFFVNFSLSAAADPEAPPNRGERLNHFLTDIELARARKYRDEVVARIPRPPESYFRTLQAGFEKVVGPESAVGLLRTVRQRFEPEPMPYRRNQDFRLRYWEPRDVAGWAEFIEAALPRALEEMESWTLPQPNASRSL